MFLALDSYILKHERYLRRSSHEQLRRVQFEFDATEIETVRNRTAKIERAENGAVKIEVRGITTGLNIGELHRAKIDATAEIQMLETETVKVERAELEAIEVKIANCGTTEIETNLIELCRNKPHENEPGRLNFHKTLFLTILDVNRISTFNSLRWIRIAELRNADKLYQNRLFEPKRRHWGGFAFIE
jgi:hypothetical protein